MNTLGITRTSAVFANRTEAVRIVYEKTEPVFSFVFANFLELALVTGHTEDPFGHH